MTTAARTNFGAVLKLADSGGSPAAIAELTSVGIPGRSVNLLDATSHDSSAGAREFIAEDVYDTGEIAIEGHYIAGSTEDDLFIAALEGAVKQDFEILAKKGTSGTETISGSCFVQSYEPAAMDIEGKQTFSAVLKVTGALTQAVTA